MILVGFKLVELVDQLVSSLNQLMIVILGFDDDHFKAGNLSPLGWFCVADKLNTAGSKLDPAHQPG